MYFEENKEMFCNGAELGHLTAESYPISNTEIINLKLANSKSISFDSDVFHKMEYLINLNLRGNKLNTLDSRLFSHSYSLITLVLSDNKLKELEPGLFSSLHDLQDLYISGNQLTSLTDPNIFISQGKLIILKIEQNNITTISEGVFTPLKSIKKLKLSNNPFECTCVLQGTMLWTEHKCLKPEANCANPAKFKGKSWSFLRQESCGKPLIKDDHNCSSNICTYFGETQNMDCSNLNLNYFESNDLPFNESKIKILHLRRNEIETLQSDIFNQWPTIEYLSLSNNKLRALDYGLFHRLTQLKRLELAYNELEFLDERLFLFQNKLEKLYLSDNRLSTISEKLPNHSLHYIFFPHDTII
ncbi:hypothetical protein L9F63_019945 [Diploptera punctata]|uniref:LRRCT domain-containing protein n=1 Tax=Diploptera punctata TaxID=6984 RepID=A0AAD7ZTJ4_DIPPU|nr:hypothetical protein L9F63_019945 [Diploptera punctata]